MFERFTDPARRVIDLAQDEAGLFSHNYIGTEHLLLGLIREGGGIAVQVLVSFGISLSDASGQVEDIIGHGVQIPSGRTPFTPRAKKVFDLSLREAQQLGHNYIASGHLLLGIIREGEGVAAQVLTNLGVDLYQLRVRTRELLVASSTELPRRPPPERENVHPAGLDLPFGVSVVIYGVPTDSRKEVLSEVAERLREWAAKQ